METHPQLPVKKPSQVYKDISRQTAVSPQTVKTVVEGLSDYIIEQLMHGTSVRIPSFHFTLGFRSFSEEARQKFAEQGCDLPPLIASPRVVTLKTTKDLFKTLTPELSNLIDQAKQ